MPYITYNIALYYICKSLYIKRLLYMHMYVYVNIYTSICVCVCVCVCVYLCVSQTRETIYLNLHTK